MRPQEPLSADPLVETCIGFHAQGILVDSEWTYGYGESSNDFRGDLRCASGGASEIKAYHSLQGMLPPGVKGDREETHFLRLNS